MVDKRILIGLHGKPQVGKSTVATHLCKKYNLMTYGPSVRVKLTTAAMFDFPVEYLDNNEKKDQMDPFWGMTYRQMAQKVGKESSRDVFGDDIWMRHVEKELLKREEIKRKCQDPTELTYEVTLPDGKKWSYYDGIVLADVRYANEVQWIKDHDGCVVYIIREGAPKTSDQGHVVDAGLPIELANYIVYNNTTIEKMNEQADGCLQYYFKR